MRSANRRLRLLLSIGVLAASCRHGPPKPPSHEVTAAAFHPGSPDGRYLERSASPVWLAREGKALLPIVIASDATPAEKAIADELADYLRRITGASFEVTKGDVSPDQLLVPRDLAAADGLAVRK